MAYGPLELKPREFEKLQPHEFNALVKGYTWRQERREDLAAYFVSILLNASGKIVKKHISPKELIAPLRKAAPKRDKKDDEEYLKATFGDRLGGE